MRDLSRRMDRVHPARRHPHSDKLAQKALEIVHRDFSELRDVEDERIHFSMFVNKVYRGFAPMHLHQLMPRQLVSGVQLIASV